MAGLHLALTARIEGHPNGIEFSPGGRWVGLHFGDAWRLWDALTGTPGATLPLAARHMAIAPDGQAIATLDRERVSVINAAGQAVTRAYPHSGRFPGYDLCFTADSRQFWCTLHDAAGNGRLALLDATTLDEISAVPMPVAAERAADPGTLRGWDDPTLVLHEATDTLGVYHLYGDRDLLGLFFFRRDQDRSAPAGLSIYDERVRLLRYCCFFRKRRTVCRLRWPLFMGVAAGGCGP